MNTQKKEYVYSTTTFGKIHITLNSRAKRFIIRMKEQHLHITMPAYCPVDELDKLLQENEQELLKIMAKHKATYVPDPLFTDGKMNTLTFMVELQPNAESNGVHYRLYEGTLSIIYPSTTPLTDPALQRCIKKIIDHYLRNEAKRVLIPLTHKISKELGLELNNVKITSSHTRWGSCTGQRNINLSMYLLTKPQHLVEYVIKHELAHLTEMNHSAQFWALLNDYCQCNALNLRKELNSGAIEY